VKLWKASLHKNSQFYGKQACTKIANFMESKLAQNSYLQKTPDAMLGSSRTSGF
jgi:hypothetical protein